MELDERAGSICILNDKGEPTGTGFLVGRHLAVTCAHVITDANGTPGGKVKVRFYYSEQPQEAQVLEKGWSAPEEDDVAFLKVEGIRDSVFFLLYGAAGAGSGRYSAFGYARNDKYKERWAQGDIGGLVQPANRARRATLQLNGEALRGGMSGALVIWRDRVISMVNEEALGAYKVENETGTERERLVYGVTSDTLKYHWPGLSFEPPNPDRTGAGVEQAGASFIQHPLADVPDLAHLIGRTRELNRIRDIFARGRQNQRHHPLLAPRRLEEKSSRSALEDRAGSRGRRVCILAGICASG